MKRKFTAWVIAAVILAMAVPVLGAQALMGGQFQGEDTAIDTDPAAVAATSVAVTVDISEEDQAFTEDAEEETTVAESIPLRKTIAIDVLDEEYEELAALYQSGELNLRQTQVIAGILAYYASLEAGEAPELDGELFDHLYDTLVESGKGIGATILALELEPKEVMPYINQAFKRTKSEIQGAFKAAKSGAETTGDAADDAQEGQFEASSPGDGPRGLRNKENKLPPQAKGLQNKAVKFPEQAKGLQKKASNGK